MKKILTAICLVCSFWIGNAASNAPVVGQNIASYVAGAAIDFGNVSVGSSSNATISGTNNTPATLFVFIALIGQDAQDFSVATQCFGAPLVVGASCSGVVSFHPSSPGEKSAVLIIVARGTWYYPVVVSPDEVTSGLLFPKVVLSPLNTLLYTETRVLSGKGI